MGRTAKETEVEAIRTVLAGDREAYRTLVDAHYRIVFRTAFRITGDLTDAEDVSQETFLRAYNRLSTFRQDSSFGTWITRIAINAAINLVERRERDTAGRDPGTSDLLATLPDGDAGPERILLSNESARLRSAAMLSLTPMERTAFTLRHMEDLPMAEIAAALNVPANSAKQAVFRAVGKLRRALAPVAGAVR